MGDRVRGKIAKGPKRQRHQAGKEKHRETEDAVNHFLLGNQVHEKPGDEERLATCNHQRDRDIDFTAGKVNVRGPHRKGRADNERGKNIQVPAHMMGDMIVRFRMGLVAHKSQ